MTGQRLVKGTGDGWGEEKRRRRLTGEWRANIPPKASRTLVIRQPLHAARSPVLYSWNTSGTDQGNNGR